MNKDEVARLRAEVATGNAVHWNPSTMLALCDMADALIELVACDEEGVRTTPQQGIHDHGCPATRYGRTVSGPCNCPGDEATARVKAAWLRARELLR